MAKQEQQVIHSLTDTLKNLLRDVGVSKEINDFIAWHAAGDAAGRWLVMIRGHHSPNKRKRPAVWQPFCFRANAALSCQ